MRAHSNLRVITSSPSPKFDDAFLDRRMREHREWQEWATAVLEAEVFKEVTDTVAYAEHAKIVRLK
jgi:hypothetical protein